MLVAPRCEVFPIGSIGLERLLGVTAFDLEAGAGEQVGNGRSGFGSLGHELLQYDETSCFPLIEIRFLVKSFRSLNLFVLQV